MKISCKGTETTTIHFPDCHGGLEPRRRTRSSFLTGRMESLKLTVLTRGKKAEYGFQKVEEADEDEEEGPDPKTRCHMRRPSFEVILPQQEARVGDERARQFPADWQTSLSPPGSVLRGNTTAGHKSGSRASCNRTSRIWPALGSHCKFFRFIVVASPSLQSLAFKHR